MQGRSRRIEANAGQDLDVWLAARRDAGSSLGDHPRWYAERDKGRCTMHVGELLDQVRQYYLDRFINVRDELLAEQNSRLILEPELRGSDGAVVTEGALQLPLRTDFAVIKDGGTKTLSIDTERMLSFEPISFIWGAGLEVRLGPFQWQAMRLQVPLPETTRWQPLQHWYWRWFKEDAGEHNEALAGAVHFLSDPEVADGGVTFAVDLGAAPVEAFEDLLDALEMMGAKHCEIGHPEGSVV